MRSRSHLTIPRKKTDWPTAVILSRKKANHRIKYLFFCLYGAEKSFRRIEWRNGAYPPNETEKQQQYLKKNSD